MPDRNVVYLVGEGPPALAEYLTAQMLAPKSIQTAEDLTATDLVIGRAVLLAVGDIKRLRQRLLRLYAPVLDAGCFFGVVLRGGTETTDERARVTAVVESVVEDIASIPASFQILSPDVKTIARACGNHDPGRSEDFSLVVQVADGGTFLDPQESTLLRRAFQGYRKVSISSLSGGYTGSRLFAVEATTLDDVTCAPYVAKIGIHSEIDRELEQIRSYVLDRVPFPNHPAVDESRCPAGAAQRILTSRLVQFADRFDSFIPKADPTDVTRAIDLLFCGALRIWRSQHKINEVDIAQWYHDAGVIPHDLTRLREAFTAAQVHFSKVDDPTTLLESLRRLPRIKARMMHSHGDLHIRNIFARRHPENGTLIDVVLIDFAEARAASPSSRDLATLEVSIAFDAIPEFTDLAPETLAEWYRDSPLLLPSAPSGDPRLEGIAAIRQRANSEGVDPREYRLSLIAYLLRFAKFQEQALPQRARAYGSAWALADAALADTTNAA